MTSAFARNAPIVGGGPLEVTPVGGAEDLREFVELPERLYQGVRHWVPPLRSEERRFLSERNPYVAANPVRLFLARERGVPVGRVAATVCSAHNAYHHERTGFFGFFECDGRAVTARALLGAAAQYVRDHGMRTLRGPFNFTTNHTCGVLVEGFEGPPIIEMPYHPPHYGALLEDAGLRKAKDLFALWHDIEQGKPQRQALAGLARAAPAAYAVRELRRSGRGFAEDMDRFYDLYHQAWRGNWGFVPVPRDEFVYIGRRMQSLLRPGLCHVVTVRGETAGMVINLPDYSPVLSALRGRVTPGGALRAWWASRRVDASRCILVGVYDRFRGTPATTLLVHHLLEGAARAGYRGVETSWVLEDNAACLRGFGKHGFVPYRRYRIYEQPVA